MQIPLDYKDLLRLLNKYKVKYLVIGAYAVIYYTEPRYTKDLDILIEPTLENAKKVYLALKEFGAPLQNISVDDFTKENLVYQIGVAPVRVDIIIGIKDVNFSTLWKNRTITHLENQKASIIGLKELIKLKQKTKRDIDLIDLKELRYTWNKKKKKK